VVDVLDREIALVFVAFAAAELGAVLVMERHDPVVQDPGCGDRGLAAIQLGEGHLGRGVDDTLLIDPPDPLQRAGGEAILRAAVAGAPALELNLRRRSAPR
jgi:hypothetical protein